MPDISTMDGVAAADIGSIDGVAKANISTLGGVSVPSAVAATQWAVGFNDAGIGYAASTDLTSWSTFYAIGSSSVDFVNSAYGTNGSGVERWMWVWTRGAGEIITINDITGESTGGANVDIKMRAVAYCNDTWIIGGELKTGAQKLYTSTDGTSMTSRDLSGLANIADSPDDIYDFAHDGVGKVVFTTDEQVFYSTDKGATWAAALTDIEDSNSVGKSVLYIKDQDCFVLVYKQGSSGMKFRVASADDLTTWTSGVSADASGESTSISSLSKKAMAAAGSTFVICYAQSHQRFTVSGTTITPQSYTAGQLPHDGVNDIATDGTSWITCHNDGELSISTNDGASFTSLHTGLQAGSGDDEIETITCNVILPV
tara:strand:+ start:3028 stop:4140 length:1113 start_codon:yes stop_codon:yes gene_type:complete